jgi:hypothetical protein
MNQLPEQTQTIEERITKMRFGTFNGREIVLAAHQNRICDLSDLEPLKQALRYVMTLIGIKAENMPSESQKMVLFDFVKSELGFFSPEEFRIAFKLAAAKKLNCEVDHWQNFSAAYVGRIMDAYNTYKANAMREYKSQLEQKPVDLEMTEQEKSLIFYEFVETYVVTKFELYRDTGVLQGTLSGFGAVFSALEEKLKLIQMTLDDKKRIYEMAKSIHQQKNQSRKATSKDDAKSIRLLAEKVLKDGYENVFEGEIKKMCYEMCVKTFYDDLIKNKRDLRQIIEQFKQEQYE